MFVDTGAKKNLLTFTYVTLALFCLCQVSCWSSAAYQAGYRPDGMWGSHGPHNNVHGPSGHSLRSTAGTDPDHQHLSAATTAATAATGAAGTATVTGHSHTTGAGPAGPTANTIPTGNNPI